MRSKRLKILQDLFKIANDGYGGTVFELPSSHKGGMISKQGFSCAVCKFIDTREDGPYCINQNWVKWNNGESRLPVDDPKTYCSDWFETK